MFKVLFETISDLIYKNKCVICGCSKTDSLLCKTCAKDVNYLSGFPHRVYNDIPIYSAFIYEKNIKKLIQLLKFQHKRKISSVLAHLLFKYFKTLNLNDEYIVIYPNSFLFKSMTRGYEHMYLIAKEFCDLSDLNVCKDAIIKIKNTAPQYQAKNRKNNIKDSFKINKKYIELLKNNKILLIDDITTSGSTIEEIVDLLQKNGVYNITCLTISKAV